MKDLVSIIMPSCNTAGFIGEAIQSVLAQTYSNWELLIVDDGSTDNSLEIIRSFPDPRIRLFSNPVNSGAAAARNQALREARGEWIAFLDSDDLWLPEKLEHQLRFMQAHGYLFSYHCYEKINEASHPLGIMVTGPQIVTRKKMYHYGYPGCLTFLYNAEKLGLVQIENIPKNNDYAILLQLCKKADCYLLPENLAKYRIRSHSISHDALWKKVLSHYQLFRICDRQSAPTSLWFACGNLWFGIWKKLLYERKI